MKQPTFWLQITNRYVIENFEQLLKYVRTYVYEKDYETEDGDFYRTYKYLKAVADEYILQIQKMKIFQKPEFDIPTEKVIRIIAASILTAKKIGFDDHDSLSSLINLIILNNHISSEYEQEYFKILKNCIRKAPILSLSFTFRDIEEDEFLLGTFEMKLSKIKFEKSNEGAAYVYENKGSLIFEKNQNLVLTNLSYNEYCNRKLKTELSTELGIEVKTPNATGINSVDELLNIYPILLNEFNYIKPSTKAVKTYSDSDMILVRIRRIIGIKIEVETIDPAYEKEIGNVFIDKFIGLIPQRFFLNELKVGDYLPVVRNIHPTMPFRLDKIAVAEFIEGIANEYQHSGRDLQAIPYQSIDRGTRWITEEGLYVNIFDNMHSTLEKAEECKEAFDNHLPSIVRIVSTSYDDKNNCLIRGEFIESCEPTEYPDLHEFTEEANIYLVREFLKVVKDEVENISSHEEVIEIQPFMVKNLSHIIFQLADKMNHGDSFARIKYILISLLLMKIISSEEEYDFIKSEIDYQAALIHFAQGKSPSTIDRKLKASIEEIDQVASATDIIEILKGYKEITARNNKLNVSFNNNQSRESSTSIIEKLVEASNSILELIDKSEINRIKKAICKHLDVADQYRDIYGDATNFGEESDLVEFKSSCTLPPANLRSTSQTKDMELQKWTILKAVCAFLNTTTGGEILIGVMDSGFASGLHNDIELLYKNHLIYEPTSDRLRTYIKNIIDQSFITIDGRSHGTAITSVCVNYTIEHTKENLDILRIKIKPYPWDIVKINHPNKPETLHDCYIRTSGASTPVYNEGIRELKLQKMKALDKDDLKVARILQAIDEKQIVVIKDYYDTTGRADRRIEPFKVLNNKTFLAYDLNLSDIVLFKFSRFQEADMLLTLDKWKNQNKHLDQEPDIFGNIASKGNTTIHIKVKLSDFAYITLKEQCSADQNKKFALAVMRNTDVSDSSAYPWVLDTYVNDLNGIAQFIMGLPGQIKIIDNPNLKNYIKELRDQEFEIL